MSVKVPMLTVGFDKNGEAEYAVHLGAISVTPLERMQLLRAMIPVAVAELETYWRDYRPDKPAEAQAKADHK